jgi:antitoxin MazE
MASLWHGALVGGEFFLNIPSVRRRLIIPGDTFLFPLKVSTYCIYFEQWRNKMNTTAVVSKWGNSQALRLPAEITRRLELHTNDRVFLELEADADHSPKLTITKAPAPRKGTIEYLFKDYSGESFKTELVNPEEPVGEERW